uniref:Uncharacterized protein n=1 Tax=Arion vulgaris TaxID=1028688 RepID=A0A0B7A0P2_9EUPU
MAERQKWIAQVGKTYEEAYKVIKDEFPDFDVQKVPEDSMVTMDFQEKRVRIFVNELGIVVRVPRVG